MNERGWLSDPSFPLPPLGRTNLGRDGMERGREGAAASVCCQEKADLLRDEGCLSTWLTAAPLAEQRGKRLRRMIGQGVTWQVGNHSSSAKGLDRRAVAGRLERERERTVPSVAKGSEVGLGSQSQGREG